MYEKRDLFSAFFAVIHDAMVVCINRGNPFFDSLLEQGEINLVGISV